MGTEPHLTLHRPVEADRAMKSAHRAMWAMGDYDRFARATVWELGPALVEACSIGSGQRVLDVAAGTGNVAIRAALAGASVVAADLTPELFAAGRRGADEVGVHVEWIEGDAESLPFDDESFDVVTSCLGVMFAPDHRAVAGELLRVCRPGGTIGLISFTPDGRGGEFFALLAPYVPESPPGADPPVSWGSEPHVEALLGSGASRLTMRRQTYVERAESPAAYCQLFSETFGPLMAIRDGLAGTPDRLAEFDRAFLHAVRRWSGATTGPVQIGYEYLLTIARRA